MAINFSPAISSYNQSTNSIQQYMQQLSTGKKINSAADNPAYLVILQGMQNQDNGYQQAYQNVQDTTSLLNIAEGAMNDSSNVMGDMRQLSVQAANGIYTAEDRSYIQMEMNQLSSQVDFNAATTNYNGIYTNNGSLTNFTAQIGPNSGQTLTFAIGDQSASALGYSTDVSTQAAASTSIDTFDTAQQQLSASQSQIGALTNAMGYTADNLLNSDLNVQSAESTMGDTNMAAAFSALTAAQINQYASIYAMKQGMQLQQSTLSLLA